MATKQAKHVLKDPAKPLMEKVCDLSPEDGLENASIHLRDGEEDIEILSRPILVGYAFGPKKMSTMGVVMAEASKTHLSSVSTTVLVEEADEEDEASVQGEEEEEGKKITVVCGGREEDQLESHHDEQQRNSCTEEGKDTGSATVPGNTSNNAVHSSRRKKSQDNNVNNNSHAANIMLSLDSYSGGLKNIVRYLHSSCSSVDTNSTTATLLTTGTTLTGVTPSCASSSGKIGAGASICSGKSSTAASQKQQQRLRVSFVPLDPDFPLEGQHGAKMDIILHKLTEDILCLSKFSPQYPDLVPNLGLMNGHLEHLLEELQPRLPTDAKGAILRVHRLMQYQKKHPDCSLADDPAKVLTLMSRSDIAHALADCLVGVTSASGIPVASPKFVVWQPSTIKSSEDDDDDCTVDDAKAVIAQRLRDAEMSYPLIAKPLQAAGTKISHHMTVLLQQSSLERIQNSFYLLQEYANHDAVLYKVYVLGNNVHVFERNSLPNLPPYFGRQGGPEQQQQQQGPSYVDFDSQRPYPRLSAFGVDEESSLSPSPSCVSPTATSSSATAKSSTTVAVTADEVQPIVDTLKKAFGLELFGFDILITSGVGNGDDDCSNNQREMLVVDVNYFPSYKEVSNFPSLLAQYLTQRAIDSRRQPD